ncbi:MAG: hypothetical protein V4657_09365 [Pseudomonadota bacterium]
MQTLTNKWHTQPEAIALFDKAWAICGNDDSIGFPFDIEAELEALCDFAYLDGGECPVSAWDKYCAGRDAISMALAEKVAA